MPAKRIDQWNEYLNQVGMLWDEIGTDFKVGDMTRAQFTTLTTEWSTLQTRITEIETQLGIAVDERKGAIRGIQDFGVRFRTAVITKYGNRHPMVKRVPRLQTVRPPSKPMTPTPKAPHTP